MNLNLWKQHNPTFTPDQMKIIAQRSRKLANMTMLEAFKRNKHIIPIYGVLGVKKWF